MAAKRYTVDVNGSKETIQTYTVQAGSGARNEGLKFRLPKGAKIELTDDATHLGPKGIKAKRVGDDLHVALPGSELGQPDVVVQGYYADAAAKDNPTQLIGRGADGNYHAYNVDALAGGATNSPVLASSSTTPWGQVSGPVEPVIATETTGTAPPSTAPAPTSGPSMGTIGWVLGGVALVGVAAGGGGGGGGGGGDTPADRPIQSVTPEVSAATVTEGQSAVFTVTMRNAGNTQTTWKFALGGDTGTADLDADKPLVFSNGVTYDAVAGTITIPPNVTSFTVTVPTLNDALIETPEALRLTVDSTSGTVTVADDDVQKVLTVVATNGASIVEGGALSYTVTLNAASAHAETYALALTGNTGAPIAPATDVSALVFSQGVTYDPATGLITVPAGVETFTAEVATADDPNKERAEGLSFSVGGVAANGIVTDNDTQTVAAVKLTSAATVNEGAALTYQVTLSGASALAEVHSLKFGGTATADDRGAITFTNGVTYNAAAGTISVPAGVTAFQMTVASKDDLLHENAETLNASVDNIAGGTVTVNDNDAQPRISVTGPATHGEGTGTSVAYTVSLSNPSGTPVTVNYAVTGGSAAAGSDFTAASGTLTFAPGDTTETLRVVVADDTLIELGETYSVVLSAPTNAALAANASVTTTILDNDVQTVLGVTAANAAVAEGGTLVFNVTLSGASPVVTTHAFGLGGSATAADLGATVFSAGVTFANGNLVIPAGVTAFSVTVPSIDDAAIEGNETVQVSVGGKAATATLNNNDVQGVGGVTADTASVAEGGNLVFTVNLSAASPVATTQPYALGGSAAGADLGALSFTNGVTAAGGQLSIPAGVTTFKVTVPTVNDTAVENTENVQLTVGGQTATANVTDNDIAQVVAAVTVAPASVTEGGNLVYTVAFNATSPIATSYAFSLTGTGSGAADHGALAYSNGVTAAAGKLNIPAGVGTFTVTIPTTDDTAVEGAEALVLTVGGQSASATIADNDVAQAVTGVSVAPAAATEGTSLVYTVALNTPSPVATSYAFALSGTGSGAADHGALAYSDGVTAAGGRLSIPAGVGSFTVTVPVTDDTAVEGTETLQLTVGGLSAAANLIDNDVAQSVTGVTVAPASATEGAPLVYTVALNTASPVATSYAFALSGAGSNAADHGPLAYSDGVTAAGGRLTIPVGVTTFTVTVPTIDDTAVEAAEPVVLTVGGVAATATLLDNDVLQTVADVTVAPATLAEGGGNVVYTVTLSAPSPNLTSYAFSLTGTGSGAADHGALVYSDGVTAAGGRLSVPAGTSSFTVTIPVTDDAVVESAETLVLTVGGQAATSTITDNDVAQTVTDVSVAPAAAAEGASLVYTVTLSGIGTVDHSHAFTLGGTATTADRGAAVYSGGVTAAGGNLLVPAGIGSFTVTIPLTDDLLVEPSQTVVLTVGGQAATGTILDNDVAPATVQSVAPLDASVTEGAPLSYTVTLSGPAAADQTFALALAGASTATAADLNLAGATATQGVTESGGVLTVPAGVTNFVLTVPSVDDALVEADQTVVLRVGGVAAGTVTLVDNDVAAPPPPAPAPAPAPDPTPAPAPLTAVSRSIDIASVSGKASVPEASDGTLHAKDLLAFKAGPGGDLLDVRALLGATGTVHDGLPGQGDDFDALGSAPAHLEGPHVIALQSDFAGQMPTAEQVATLLSHLQVDDGSRQVLVIGDTSAPGQATIWQAQDISGDGNTALQAQELNRVQTLVFSEGTRFEDLVAQNFKTPDAPLGA